MYNHQVPKFVRSSLNRKCEQGKATVSLRNKQNSNNPKSTRCESHIKNVGNVNNKHEVGVKKKCETRLKSKVRHNVNSVVLGNRFEPLCDLVDTQNDFEANSGSEVVLLNNSVTQGVKNKSKHEDSTKSKAN